MSDTTRDSANGLAPDEKVCPYCAETIKAAAVKCRYCQSDLTVGGDKQETEAAPAGSAVGAGAGAAPTSREEADDADPEVAREDAPIEPAAAREWEPERSARLTLSGSGDGHPTGARWVAGLVVLCLVLSGALWFLVHRANHPHLDTAPNGQVTQSSFRNAAMSGASDAARQILSYSYKTFDADRKRGRALVTGQAAKEYEKAMDDVAAKVAATQITLKATVLSVGTISVKEHQARVLVFVDTSTTREGSQQQQLQQSRLVMDLTRKDGDWSVSKMDAF